MKNKFWIHTTMIELLPLSLFWLLFDKQKKNNWKWKFGKIFFQYIYLAYVN